MVNYDDEEPSEPDQRHNDEFEHGDLTEEEIRKKEEEHGVETPVSELEDSDSYLFETAAERDGPSAFTHTEEGNRRDHHPWRENYEEEIFVDLLGFDYDRHQVDVPGKFELNLEDGEVEISYNVDKRSDILDYDRPSSFLEYFVDQGVVENVESGDSYSIELELGSEPYLSLEMSYDESSNLGRKKAVQKMEVVKDLLAEDDDSEV